MPAKANRGSVDAATAAVNADNHARQRIPQTAELLSLSLALLLVILIAVSSYRDWLAFGRENEQLDISLGIGMATTDLLSILKDAETGQRGFLLTGRENYLEPYHQALLQVPQVLTRLSVARTSRPDQAQRLEVVKALVWERLDELRQTIELNRAQGKTAALGVVMSDRGKIVMDRIREACAEIQHVAYSRVAQHSQEARSASNRTRIISTAGSGVLFMLLIWASITIQRGTYRRQKLIEALQDREEQTRLIVDTALDAVITFDREGRITGWNPQAEKTFGRTREQALGHLLGPLIIPERDGGADRLDPQHDLAFGEASALRKRLEMPLLYVDGRHFPCEVAVTPIRLGADTFSSLFVRDITERKQAEQKVQAQVARLELLNRITRAIGERQDLRSIFQVVIRSLEDDLPMDFGCVCLYDSAQEILSVTSIGIKSQPLGLRLALTEQAYINIDPNGLARCVRGYLVYEPDIRTLEYPFPRRLARGGLCSMVAAPLLFESKVLGILIAARIEPNSFSSSDCEFLRQLSEHVALAVHQSQMYTLLQRAYDDLHVTQEAVMQQERLRALGQMASGIAHDINNALSPAVLYTESLLGKEELSGQIREYLEIIQRALDDVTHTVARMQEFYRQRDPQSMFTLVRLNGLVQQVLELTRARWSDMPQQRGTVIHTRTELAPDLPAVAGIEGEIREALVNLILNSVDAMPEGGTLTVRTRASTSVPPDVGVEVEDTGLGMSDETRRHCLEPFFTTKGDRGTGLGLAMVFGVARRHHAEIEIESAPGEGTIVRLIFPTATPVEAAPPAKAYAKSSPSCILVVDDDPLILKSLREILKGDGHTVTTANGGQEGINLFRQAQAGSPFDVVITDLGMPHVDGRSVASAVKAAQPSIPVILLTGWGQRFLAEGELPPHVDRVLKKPPKLKELRVALAELVANSG